MKVPQLITESYLSKWKMCIRDRYYGVEEGTKIADIKDNPRKSYFTNNLNNTLKDVIGDVAAAINLLN